MIITNIVGIVGLIIFIPSVILFVISIIKKNMDRIWVWFILLNIGSLFVEIAGILSHLK